MGIKQPIISGVHNSGIPSGYGVVPMGPLPATWTNVPDRGVISTSGVFSRLFVRLDAAPGAGKSYTFTLYVNGVASALSVIIADTDTTGNDVSNTVAINPGNTAMLYATKSGNPLTANNCLWFMQWDGGVAGETICSSCGSLSSASNQRHPVMGQGGSASGADFNHPIPAGTIKKLWVKLDADPGTAPDAYRFTVLKNGSSTALTVTITADDTEGSDLVNTVDFSASDTIQILSEPLNAPAASPSAFFGLVFAPNDGQTSLILGRSTSANTPSTTVVEYHALVGAFEDWGTEVEIRQDYAPKNLKLTQLFVVAVNAPGAGKSYTYSVRASSADAGIPATIEAVMSDANTTAWSGIANIYISPSDGVLMDIESTPSGTPTAPGSLKWVFGAMFAIGSIDPLARKLYAARII